MAQPMATHARPAPLGTAVRRVVVTPTFAAGLGVVIAAGMAYPMTKTVISYGGTPPAGGGSCLTAGCVGDAQRREPGDGQPRRSGSRRPSPAAKGPDPSAAPAPSGGGTVAAGPPPVMQYQTLRQWQSGFFGQVTITDHRRVGTGQTGSCASLRLGPHHRRLGRQVEPPAAITRCS